MRGLVGFHALSERRAGFAIIVVASPIGIEDRDLRDAELPLKRPAPIRRGDWTTGREDAFSVKETAGSDPQETFV